MSEFDLDLDEKFLGSLGKLEWIDDVNEYGCSRCNKVLVQHYISNCNHKFCSNCKRLMDDGSKRWRCPKCNDFIKDMSRQDFEFRNSVLELRLHCSNSKYGCEHICPLKDLKEHLWACEHTKESALPVLYVEQSQMELQLDELKKEMMETKKMISETENRCNNRDEKQKGVNACCWEMSKHCDKQEQEMMELKMAHQVYLSKQETKIIATKIEENKQCRPADEVIRPLDTKIDEKMSEYDVQITKKMEETKRYTDLKFNEVIPSLSLKIDEKMSEYEARMAKIEETKEETTEKTTKEILEETSEKITVETLEERSSYIAKIRSKLVRIITIFKYTIIISAQMFFYFLLPAVIISSFNSNSEHNNDFWICFTILLYFIILSILNDFFASYFGML